MHIARKIWNHAKKYHQDRVFARQEASITKVPPSQTILRKITHRDGGQKHSSRLCIMAHFDIHGRIAPYVQNYILELKRLHFDVVLVSTSPTLDERDFEFAQAHLRYFFQRQNIGLDFGSWKAVFDHMSDYHQYDELLLNNDSVFGPLFSLDEVFNKFSEMPELICGMTDSWETYYHIQSYFLFFKKQAFQSDVFKNFWASVKLSLDKNKIIDQYEVGLSRRFIEESYKLGAYVPYHRLREHCLDLGPESFQYHDLFSRQPGNPTIFMWDILIRDFRFPFLKTEILKINRKESKYAVHWRKLLKQVSAEHNIAPIESFLQRTQWNCRG